MSDTEEEMCSAHSLLRSHGDRASAGRQSSMSQCHLSVTGEACVHSCRSHGRECI